MAADAAEAADLFPFRVPPPFVDRMVKGDPRDPLLLQVLPVAAETAAVPGYVPDPLGEEAASPVPGILHKYAGRALLLVSTPSTAAKEGALWFLSLIEEAGWPKESRGVLPVLDC